MGPPRAASGETWPAMSPRVAPLKRPSVSSATEPPNPSPTIAAVTPSISRMPGPPFGSSFRMTTTSPALIFLPTTAVMASSSESKTRAGPRCSRRSCPLILATQPSGARLPFRITSPPVGFRGLSSPTMTSWPRVSAALSASELIVCPVTVIACGWRCLPPSSFFANRRIPPARCISAATNLPEGFRSHNSGVRSLTVWKSSISSCTPASRAIASRCNTAFVDPPLAATDAIAFSKASRVRMSRGFSPFCKTFMTTLPHSNET